MKAILIRDEIHQLIKANNISEFVEKLICQSAGQDFIKKEKDKPGRKSSIPWQTKASLFDDYNKYDHTQKEIAERYNLSIPTVNKIVNQDVHPSIEHFRSLKLDIDYFEWAKDNPY